MPNFIKNLGLEMLTETDEDVFKLMGVMAQAGTEIAGYYGYPYLNLHFGDAQLIARTELNEEDKRMGITGLDTHSGGSCIWKARFSGIEATSDGVEKTQKRCAIKRMEDGNGMAIVNIVNADVLPSFLDDDEVTLQMVAFPVSIDYYPDEAAYAESQPEDENGEKWLVANGTVFPSGFLRNHDPENPACEKNPALDDCHLIQGTVKAAYWGVTQFGEYEHNSYIRCIIGTQFGDLELIHTQEQVEKEQRKYIKEGCTVSGIFVLSGDAAIYEYEKGLVYDEEHHLRALRYMLMRGDAERLCNILSDDVVYVSDALKAEYRGKDAVVERLDYIRDNTVVEYNFQMATVTSVDNAVGAAQSPYTEGKRCVVFSENEEDNHTAIAFIEMDDEKRIRRLRVTDDPRYHFSCDPKPEYKDSFDDSDMHSDVTEAVQINE